MVTRTFSDNGETVMVAPTSGFYSVPELGKTSKNFYVLKEEDLRKKRRINQNPLENTKNKNFKTDFMFVFFFIKFPFRDENFIFSKFVKLILRN